MTQKGRLVMLAIALAMGITGWYGLTHKRQAKVGIPVPHLTIFGKRLTALCSGGPKTWAGSAFSS